MGDIIAPVEGVSLAEKKADCKSRGKRSRGQLWGPEGFKEKWHSTVWKVLDVQTVIRIMIRIKNVGNISPSAREK